MDVVGVAVPVLLLFGFLASLSLAAPGAGGLLGRVSWPLWGMAGVLVLGLAWLAVSAGQDDEYFSPGSVSRWEFADRSGASGFVVAGAVAAGVAVALLVLGARSPVGSGWRRAGMAFAAVGCLGVWIAWLAMTIGH